MWRNRYRDYPPDGDWNHEKVEPGKGIIGCEMHEINGWSEKQQCLNRKKEGPLQVLKRFFKKRERHGP